MMIVLMYNSIHGTNHLIRLSKRDLNVVRGGDKGQEKLSSWWHLERQIVEQFSSGVAVGERSDGARGGIASSHVAPLTRSTLIILLGLPPPGATSALSKTSWPREREGETPRCRRGGKSLLAKDWPGTLPSPSWMETAMWFSSGGESFTLFSAENRAAEKPLRGKIIQNFMGKYPVGYNRFAETLFKNIEKNRLIESLI